MSKSPTSGPVPSTTGTAAVPVRYAQPRGRRATSVLVACVAEDSARPYLATIRDQRSRAAYAVYTRNKRRESRMVAAGGVPREQQDGRCIKRAAATSCDFL